MSYEVWAKKDEDVRYRIKDYTGEDFTYRASNLHTWYDWQKEKCLSVIAEEVGANHFFEDPCDLNNYECDVDILYKGKIYPFKVTGQPSVDWETKPRNYRLRRTSGGRR